MVLDRYAGSWFIADSSNTVIVSVMVEEKGRQAEERQDEPRLWRPWRPPRRRMGWRVLWAVGMVVALVVALLTTALLIVPLHPEIWKDLLEGRVLTLVALGFSLTAIVGLLAIAGARRSWTGFQGKTVWDFLQLLIVPLMLVAVGVWFTTQQEVRQQQIEDQRSQDIALQAYFDGMTNLLIDEQGNQLRKLEPDTAVERLIQARTETLLAILDKDREVSVVLFLARSDVIPKGDPLVSLAGIDLSFIDLRGIDLSETSLSRSDLRNADLSEANLSRANLSRADLFRADLSRANLSEAYLSEAYLSEANLFRADLSEANLFRADVSHSKLSRANLGGANMSRADLHDADLREANLSEVLLLDTNLNGANLGGADLSEAKGVTNEQLRAARFPEGGATMPNGQILKSDDNPDGPTFEEWLKSKGSGEVGEGSGPS